MSRKDLVTFKFSVNRKQDPELIAFLRAIPSKNERGHWIRKALVTYMEIEKAACYDPDIYLQIVDCIRKINGKIKNG